MDLTAQVIDAINAWLQSTAAQLLGPALAAAGQLLFQTPAFDEIPEVSQTWSLVRDIADALFVLALIAAGALIMAAGTTNARYSAKELVARIALAAIAANASLALCGALIRLDNALVTGLLGSVPGSTVLADLASIVVGGGSAGPIVDVFVALAAAVLALLLVALFIGRDLILLAATVLAPLALAAYALPQTEEIARFWWRVFVALLFVQVVQAVVIALGIQLLHHTDWLGGPVSALTSGLVLITLLYVLFKLPFVACSWAFRAPLLLTQPAQAVWYAARSAVAGA